MKEVNNLTRRKFRTIDEHIESSPRPFRTFSQRFRQTIGKAVPEADEKVSYQIPTFTLRGNRAHFAAFQATVYVAGERPVPNDRKWTGRRQSKRLQIRTKL